MLQGFLKLQPVFSNMEDLFSLKYGIGGICALLTISILFKVAEFVWKIREKKEMSSDMAMVDLTKAVQECTLTMKVLDIRLKAMEMANSEFPKLRNDLRRVFTAMKEIAGDKWPMVRDEIMKDGC